MTGAALCLDLSRLVSRVGRGPWTGIDRVEASWAERLLQEDRPVFALVRLRFGYALLDRDGMAALWLRLTGAQPWGLPDPLSRVTPGLMPPARSVESDLRRLARGTCLRPRLGALLRSLPGPLVYLNLGHSNLTARVLRTMATRPETRTAVLVHDLIPLSHPHYQRPGTPETFAARMRRVAAHADLVLYNSAATQAEAEQAFGTWGRVPEGLVAHLGIPLPAPAAAALPAGLPPARPYFVCLGTIEPRKNHALLLDLWERLTDPPPLLILGSRGWNNDAVFARLDARPSGVLECPGLNDAQVTHLLRGAAALLFPSHAEGYGLPALEAAALGTPVVCSPLPVFKELLGTYPVYAPPTDPYPWETAIRELAGQARSRQALSVPTWDAHFNLVLSRL